MSVEPENLIHRLLERMRAEHAASLEAMIAELTATRRVYASMEQVNDKVDRLQADLSALRNDVAGFRRDMAGFRSDMAGFRNDMARVGGEMVALRGEMSDFRAETSKALRQVQSDVVALENQNIARHGEILNILRRLDDIEVAMDGEGSRGP